MGGSHNKIAYALCRSSSVTVSEALAVLLQTWNKAYYRYRSFDAGHFFAIDALVTQHRRYLARLRKGSIERLELEEKPTF